MSKYSDSCRKNWSKSDYERDKNLKPLDNVTIIKDLKYGTGKKYNLLDVYYPKGTNKKIPVIVSIHGGGYVYGTKEIYFHYCLYLASLGFSVVNFNYHLAPEKKFPTQLNEINMVMNWICSNKDKYYFDVDNVFVVGDSAGAQLASHYACIYSNEEFEKLFPFKTSKEIKIRALGLNCGRYEMASAYPNKTPKIYIKHHQYDGTAKMNDYLGKDREGIYEMTQVIDNITSKFPPSHIMTAYYDFLKEDAQPMNEFLISLGVESEYKLYGNENTHYMSHDFHVNMNLCEAKQANNDQIEFFKKHII